MHNCGPHNWSSPSYYCPRCYNTVTVMATGTGVITLPHAASNLDALQKSYDIGFYNGVQWAIAKLKEEAHPSSFNYTSAEWLEQEFEKGER